MKKFMLGLIVGVTLTAATSTYAEEIVQSVVGKKVDGQFPVKIAGKSLETQAAVVDGTSYLPVRAIGEALNMDVKFDSISGIELSRKGATNVINPTLPLDKEAIRKRIEDINNKKDLNDKIIELNKKRKAIADEIPQYYDVVRTADHRKISEENFVYDDAYYAAKQKWEEKKAELAEIDKQIADLYAEAQQ